MSKFKKFAVGALAATALVGGSVLAAAPAQATIILFDDLGYDGLAKNIGGGYRSSLPGFNDKTTSFTVNGGNTVKIYEDENYKGASTKTWYQSKPDLRKYPLRHEDWNDRASSVE